MIATSEIFFKNRKDVSVSWDARPLQDFESQPLRELAEDYDLIIIDHPHLGEAVRENLLVDLSTVDRENKLSMIAKQNTGPSHESYELSGGQWALAVDAATPVASYRPDRIDGPATNWAEVLDIAREGQVIMPLRSPHTLMAFFWFARNRNAPVAQNPDQFMNYDDITTVLDQFSELVNCVKSDCFEMDPIAVYDLMSTDADAPAYCPHAYGYISYARNGFRKHTLQFANVADVAGGGVSGTVLGGTGIAVSALSPNKALTTDYAFYIAGHKCQSKHWVSSGGQPGNARAWEDKECNRISNNFLVNTRATLDAAWIRPRYEGYLTFQSQGSEIVSNFLKREISQKLCIDMLESHYLSSFT